MATVACPFGDECLKPVPMTGKKEKASPVCPHAKEHEHTALCNNTVCQKVMPKSAGCVPVKTIEEIPVEEKMATPVVCPDCPLPNVVEKDGKCFDCIGSEDEKVAEAVQSTI